MLITNQLPKTLEWLCPVGNMELTRLGNLMDGGYVLPVDLINRSQALLSLGLGDNWTFDEDWHSKKPTDAIHLYDGTVNRDQLRVQYNVKQRAHLNLIQEYDKFFTGPVQHIKENIGPGPDQTSLATCLDRLKSQKVFVKMDIEGGEYALIEDLINFRDKITGMIMEFHFCNSHRQQFQTAVTRLQKYYTLVHLHANNHVDIGPEGLTDCLELTWVNNDHMPPNPQPRKKFYVDGLDFSNVAELSDWRYCF